MALPDHSRKGWYSCFPKKGDISIAHWFYRLLVIISVGFVISQPLHLTICAILGAIWTLPTLICAAPPTDHRTTSLRETETTVQTQI